ncbi:YrbL family protein [Roseitranquillus sediminis]|uniref:YrbL family protein n=1 Tax=Roseitranquillus sediminis TaxID=2809051 RepID=UPI001D0C10D2|nr:YrbL family protein [Roseitranquillus sediminis]MBM9593805.1 hypothetical protein [Roseitranquillus sediminis]
MDLGSRDDTRLANNEAWYLVLAGETPIARGGESEVYERPGKPSQLVKVQRSYRLERMMQPTRLKDRLKMLTPSGPYKNIVREYRAYLEATMLGIQLGRPPPLAHLRGLIATDRGMGQLVQKLRAADGSVAPTLKQLARRREIDDQVLAALNEFVGEIYVFNIVATDLRWKNLVYETRRGRSRVVMIDGFGVRTFIPVRRWFRRLNARKLDDLFVGLGNQLDLHFDRKLRTFRR